MKAMTWLKIGGGALVVLAAFAAADTRYAEVTKEAHGEGYSHAIASRIADGCFVSSNQQTSAGRGCCKKDSAEPPQQTSHPCYRK